MVNRAARAAIADETVQILERGHYEGPNGVVSIADALAHSARETTLYTPVDVAEILDQRFLEQAASPVSSHEQPRQPEVTNCTTFAGARALLADDPTADVLCLNFASAKKPGGGFLGGSQAQEEALARASGLYHSLLTQPDYYANNRSGRSSLYTDHMIYSPSVPVFRDDGDQLLAAPFLVSIITAPAPNAGAIAKNQPTERDDIRPTMQRRIDAVLAIAKARRHRHLVLGAWGCGVFQNDPAEVAQLFRDGLESNRFAGAFDRVTFAVLDRTEQRKTFETFRMVLAP